MMSVKGGTQTWSKSIQQGNDKAEKNQGISTSDQAKYFGDKNIGEVLNQVADPNWVDPVKTRKVGNDTMGKDGFLKLFLAQLKNQDPTNPMKGHDLAAQLAQFTSLEKLNNIDEGITSMAKGQSNPQGDFQILNLIGKSVAGDSSNIMRGDLEEQHDIRFSIPKDAVKVKLSIKNAENQVIRVIELPSVKSGNNAFSWNGLDNDGRSARLGNYTVDVEAKDSAGKKIAAQTKFEGKISGVNFTNEGAVLMIGNQTVRMQDVKKIFDAGAGASKHSITIKDPMKAVSTGPIGKVGSILKEAGKSELPSQGNIGQLGMSREMSNRVKKDTGSNQGIL